MEGIIGVYIQGALAKGDFNPHHSDIDILVVIKRHQ
jgi:predicted nucleotidyltransferase